MPDNTGLRYKETAKSEKVGLCLDAWEQIYASLKQRKILVRYMRFPDVSWANDSMASGLRVSIGTDAETDVLLAALREIL